jgi:hypothetical protein
MYEGIHSFSFLMCILFMLVCITPTWNQIPLWREEGEVEVKE